MAIVLEDKIEDKRKQVACSYNNFSILVIKYVATVIDVLFNL